MTKEKARIFLTAMLTECVAQGHVERLSEFFMPDVKGHTQDTLFHFRDIQKRSELFPQTIKNFHLEMIDLTLLDEFILLFSRQRGYANEQEIRWAGKVLSRHIF